MADVGLQIKIGADVAQGVQGVKAFNAEISKTAGLEKNVAAAVTSASKAVTTSGASLKAAGQALATVKPGSDQAMNALTNLGRVAQDIPFGFVGIQNNLNPLLESFQRLGSATAGAGGPLKALGAALAGPAGVGLALSVVSAIVLKFGDEILDYATKTTFAEKQQKALNKAIGEAQAATTGEVANIRSLVALASDEAASRKVRSQALQSLQDQYPGYFDNLRADGKLTENLKLATDRLTQSIILNAQAKAIQAQIDESAKRKAEAQNSSLTDNLSLLQKIGAVVRLGVFGAADAGVNAANKGLDNLNKTVKDEDDLQKKLAAQLQNTNRQLAEQGSLFDKPAKKQKEVDPLKDRVSQLEALKTSTGLLKIEEEELLAVRIKLAERDQVKNGLNAGQLERQIQSLTDKADLEVKIKPVLAELPPIGKINTDLATLGRSLTPLSTTLNIKLDEAGLAIKKFGETMQAALGSAISNVAQGIGDVLGEALSGGNPLAAGLALIADTLIQLGKAAVAAGIAMIGIKNLFKNPTTAIIAGVAAIAVGQAVKSKIPKFAEGGLVTGPTVGLIGEAGPEVVFPLNKARDFMQGMVPEMNNNFSVTHRVSGSELLLVIERARNQYGSTRR